MRSIIICICVKSSSDKERLMKTRNVCVLVGVNRLLRLSVLLPFVFLERGMYYKVIPGLCISRFRLRLSVASSNCSTPFCVFKTRYVHLLVVIRTVYVLSFFAGVYRSVRLTFLAISVGSTNCPSYSLLC